MRIIFIVAVFLIPFTNLKIISNFTLSDMTFLIIFFLAMFAGKLKIRKNLVKYIILFIIFLLSSIISTLNATNQMESISRVLQYGYIFLIILPVFLISIKELKDLSTTILTLYLSGLLIIIYTFIMLNVSPESVMTYHGRVYGIYANPWIFSLLLIIVFPVNLFYIVGNSVKWKLVNFACMILIIYMVILAGARSSFIALSVYFIYILFRVSNKLIENRFIKYSLYSCYSVLMIVGLINYKFFLISLINIIEKVSLVAASKLSTFLESDFDSGRIQIYGNGLESISNNFIVGVGPGNFSEIYGVSMHNFFFSVWVESGLFAIAALVIIYILCVKEFIVFRSHIPAVLTVISINVVFLVFMQFNPLLTLRLFWLPLVLLLSTVNLVKNKEDELI